VVRNRVAAYSRDRNGPSPTPNRKGRARCGQPDGTIVLPAGREVKDGNCPALWVVGEKSRLHSLTVVSVIADFPNNHSRSGYGMKRHYLQEFTWNGHVSLTLRRESKKKLSVPTPVGVTPPFRGIGITPRGS
jgi:hypothetical protein